MTTPHYISEPYNSFIHGETTHAMYQYRCGETINCIPPWIEGRLDCSWKTRKPPKATDKVACENFIGMKLLPL